MFNKKMLMRWSIVTLLCLVALSATALAYGNSHANAVPQPYPLPAANVVSSIQNESAISMQSYWTQERMRTARPMTIQLNKKSIAPRPPDTPEPTSGASQPPTLPTSQMASMRTTRPGTPGRSGPFVSTQAQAVPYPYAYPYSTVGKVFFTDSRTGTNYVCSGTVIVSANRSTVDTAGHCVADGGSRYFYKNWVFCPQYYNGCPSGYLWTARLRLTHSHWYNDGWLTYDYGEVVLNTNSNGYVADVVGSAGWSYGQSYQQQFTALGYPQGPPFDGTQLWQCASPLYRTDRPNPGPASLGIACDMTGGSSGGGWLISVNGTFGYLNGHNDYKYTSDSRHMYSPYYGKDWYNLYNSAQNS